MRVNLDDRNYSYYEGEDSADYIDPSEEDMLSYDEFLYFLYLEEWDE